MTSVLCSVITPFHKKIICHTLHNTWIMTSFYIQNMTSFQATHIAADLGKHVQSRPNAPFRGHLINRILHSWPCRIEIMKLVEYFLSFSRQRLEKDRNYSTRFIISIRHGHECRILLIKWPRIGRNGAVLPKLDMFT